MEEELDVREALATGERLGELIVRIEHEDDLLRQVISYLDDDLWIVQKNAIISIMTVVENRRELHDPLLRKLLVMIRKSEAVPLTLEIAKAIGKFSKIRPDLVRRAAPVIFANFRIGDPKIKVNMAYVLEEIMRQNPVLLGNIVREIMGLLSSPDEMDRLAALNFISALGENKGRYVTPFLPRLFALLNEKDELLKVSTIETLSEVAVANPKLRKIIKAKLSEVQEGSELVMKTLQKGLTQIALAEASKGSSPPSSP